MIQRRKKVLTIDEGCQALGLSRGSLYRAVARGQIPSLRIGRRLVIPVAALDRLLQEPPAKQDSEGAEPKAV